MNIDEFIQSERAGDCRILRRLYGYFEEHKRDPAFYVAGLTLLDIEPYGGTVLYDSRMTPINTRTFATTGGDDVHFGMLSRHGLFADHSPVVMTVPMADENPEQVNFVVSESLHDFLCLGCVHGFFDLEKLAYDWRNELFEELAIAPRLDDDGPYSKFRAALSLSPWREIEFRLQELDRKYKSMLKFIH
jgi:hypothetical protein